MNQCIVKEEEDQFHTKESLPKTILDVNQSYQQDKTKKKERNRYNLAINKFYKALHNLIQAQNKEYGSDQPKYPFVLQYSYNEYMIHLGNNKVNLDNNVHLDKFQSQIHHYVPKQSNNIPPPIKQTLQKRRGMSILDQKDTKNIPKNYCKAIITFACKNQGLCQQILKDQLKVAKFLDKISVYKKQLLNIRTFSSLLQPSDDPEEEEFNRTFRILSRIFVKKHAANYIFNSKIVQHHWHLRYRYQVYKGIKNPKNFSHIKNL